MAAPDYRSIRYAVAERVATIMLDRPARLNAIDRHMPGEIESAVKRANDDDRVHVIVVEGAGRAFCAGYDLQEFAQTSGPNRIAQDMPWDPMLDFKLMWGFTQNFMSLWRSFKPTIAKVRQYAVAGGSDIATCCDFIVMEETAKIGYPPTRVWGCPSVAMWVFRIGAMHAKRMLLTGDLIDGVTARDYGLAMEAVAPDKLDETVAALAARMAGVPKNQLMMNKMMVNSAIENMGLTTTQQLATFFDGVTRHTPEGMWWKERAAEVGFKQAVQERDSGDPIAGQVEKRLPPWPQD